MSERRKISFVGVAQIPVGHRVKVTHFQRKESKSSFFGGSSEAYQDVGPPRLEDLQTGIVYAHFLHHNTGGIFPGRVNVTSTNLLADLEVREEYIGVVKACQLTGVSFARSGSDFAHTETHLELEPED